MNGSVWMDKRRATGAVALVALALVLGLIGPVAIATAQETQEKLPSAEQILERSIEAMGGRAAFEKLHNRVSRGYFEVPGRDLRGTLISFEAAPHKAYTLIEMPGMGKIESGGDGDVFWEMSAMQGARILDGDEKAMKARDSRFNGQIYWRELYKNLECTGKEDVDDIPCYKVVMTPEEGAPQTVYYAVKNHLPIKVLMKVKSPMGEISIDVRLEDYKTVDGVLLHHKVVQRMLGMEQAIVLESIQHNADLPPDRFALPEPVKALLAKAATQPGSPTTRPVKP